MILAIDFDNVVHDQKHPLPGGRMGAPIEGAADAMYDLKQQGHKLIIHSVGGGNSKYISDWLEYYEIPYDLITNIKPNADYYLDDKAVHFDNWDQALRDMGVDE